MASDHAASNGAVLLRPNNPESSSSKHKLAKDGHTILIPQPTDSPSDPLNWSSFRKHIILICVSLGAFAGDFGMGIGIPAGTLQSEEWNLSASTVNNPNNLAVLMIGISSLIWVPLVNCWGRAPVLFWSTVMGFFFTLGCIHAPDFDTYYAMRALQGLTQGTGSTIGLVLIQDMFFFHEHARKIGLWYSIFLISPFAGPILGNFMVAGLGEWRPLFWLVFAWSGTLVIMIVVFIDETYYNRDIPVDQQPHRSLHLWDRVSRVVGLWQLQIHHGYYKTVVSSYFQLIRVALRPVIPIASICYGLLFMWSIGINQTSSLLLETPISAGGYGLDTRGIGYIYFSPVVAVCIGELLGHYLNDYVVLLYAKRHKGQFVSEARLWSTYLGAVIMVPGIVLVGITLERHLHWVGIVFGWGMFQTGVMIISVAMVAYVLDCYPAAPGEVSGFINLCRAASGFAVGYFQQPWGETQGYDLSFGLQGVITVVTFLIVACLHVFGGRLRRLGMAAENSMQVMTVATNSLMSEVPEVSKSMPVSNV